MTHTVAMLRSRSVRLMLVLMAFGWAPLSATGAVSVYFGVHVMGYTEETASLVMLTWFVAGLAWPARVAGEDPSCAPSGRRTAPHRAAP